MLLFRFKIGVFLVSSNSWIQYLQLVAISILANGLDDLHDWTNNVQPSIPIYGTERDFEIGKRGMQSSLCPYGCIIPLIYKMV
ncbi:hypothetical protein K2173_003940 [Erythroxylum novogranatense]|uniref:Uncharacterized protein n=1 Tax=Erythroxylum novogranatense TaxID=1862640 RepID=A0AAV8SJR1_9ROSI|nr:hypothetical protein K2173_003940 [Erythroxylum novogranatense]